jgi:hypothetical protein
MTARHSGWLPGVSGGCMRHGGCRASPPPGKGSVWQAQRVTWQIACPATRWLSRLTSSRRAGRARRSTGSGWRSGAQATRLRRLPLPQCAWTRGRTPPWDAPRTRWTCTWMTGASPTPCLSRVVSPSAPEHWLPLHCPHPLHHPLRSAASRLHAAVVHHPSGKVYLIDLGSTRGTQVDALKLDKHRPLQIRDGFTLRFGCDLAAWVYTVRIDARCVTRVCAGRTSSVQRSALTLNSCFACVHPCRQERRCSWCQATRCRRCSGCCGSQASAGGGEGRRQRGECAREPRAGQAQGQPQALQLEGERHHPLQVRACMHCHAPRPDVSDVSEWILMTCAAFGSL